MIQVQGSFSGIRILKNDDIGLGTDSITFVTLWRVVVLTEPQASVPQARQ